MMDGSNENSKVHDNTQSEFLGDSTVDQIKVLTDSDLINVQKQEPTVHALDLENIQVGSICLMGATDDSTKKHKKQNQVWIDDT